SAVPYTGSCPTTSKLSGAAKMMPLERPSVMRLKASPETTHIGFHDATTAPVLVVDPGDELWIQTFSADPAHDVPREWLPAGIGDILQNAKRGTGPHILTGPI